MSTNTNMKAIFISVSIVVSSWCGLSSAQGYRQRNYGSVSPVNPYYRDGLNGPHSYYSRGSTGTPAGIFVGGMRYDRTYVPNYSGGSSMGYVPSQSYYPSRPYGFYGGGSWNMYGNGDSNLYNR